MLRMLSAEMSFDEIIYEFPELTHEDICVSLEFQPNTNMIRLKFLNETNQTNYSNTQTYPCIFSSTQIVHL